MILARSVGADDPADVSLAFRRMGIPVAAADYLLEKVPHLQILLTGIGPTEGRFLKGLAQQATAPGVEEFPGYVPGDVRRRPGTALVSGRRDQFRRLLAAASAPELAGLKEALERLLEAPAPGPLRLGHALLDFGQRASLMGVVNVTPDSFSDGGQFLSPQAAIAHGVALAEAGADILDVGGESSRPGSPGVSAAEELRRVLPVLQGLRERTGVPLSIDTTKAEVARQALAAGATLVNDISALRFDPGMAEVVATSGAACCLMHMQGSPATMQADPHYDDVVAEVLEFLLEARARAEAAGIRRDRVLVDPGIGFGKTVGHNLLLLRRMGDLRQLGCAIVVGPSRKSFLSKLSGDKPARDRQAATLGAVAVLGASGSADLIRVHDVAQARDALAVSQAIRQAQEGGATFERGPART